MLHVLVRSSIIIFKVQFMYDARVYLVWTLLGFPVTATYDARVYLVWTLLGIIFFLRALYTKFSPQVHRWQTNAGLLWGQTVLMLHYIYKL